jgi:hypothetical protein
MSELEKNDDVETEEFTDELSDEALDRERVRACSGTASATAVPPFCCFHRAGN